MFWKILGYYIKLERKPQSEKKVWKMTLVSWLWALYNSRQGLKLRKMGFFQLQSNAKVLLLWQSTTRFLKVAFWGQLTYTVTYIVATHWPDTTPTENSKFPNNNNNTLHSITLGEILCHLSAFWFFLSSVATFSFSRPPESCDIFTGKI